MILLIVQQKNSSLIDASRIILSFQMNGRWFIACVLGTKVLFISKVVCTEESSTYPPSYVLQGIGQLQERDINISRALGVSKQKKQYLN